MGIDIVPVWNKSNREHQIIHSSPEDTRQEADAAVKELKWDDPYYVDADHINLKTVDPFLEHMPIFLPWMWPIILAAKYQPEEMEEFLTGSIGL